MKGVPITPEQTATILRVWQETGNKSEAGREAGVTEHAARLVVAKSVESTRGELHALALAKAERDYRRAVSANLKRITDALDAAPTSKDLVEVSKAMHDGLRTLSQVRTAHAKATGEHAADRIDVTSGGKPLALYLPDET